jgi:hypothetical protein
MHQEGPGIARDVALKSEPDASGGARPNPKITTLEHAARRDKTTMLHNDTSRIGFALHRDTIAQLSRDRPPEI